MLLIDQVKQVCSRLADHGWRELLLQHGLDIKVDNLEKKLCEELSGINRAIKGFEDFAFEGKRGIEPGQPARSLLYHAFSSPNVNNGVNGTQLTSFPTLAELETVENYIYGINTPSISDLRSRAAGDLALVVFASEYRPASETVHRRHADLCFSRTGIARIGTVAPLYYPQYRGFLPFVEDDNYACRVLPARYSAYIAVKRQGNKDEFGPMRFNKSHQEENNDEENLFWVPLHKLFSGTECIRDYNLHVNLKAHHVNEKLRRIHRELTKEYDTGWKEPDISASPFIFTEGIAEWSDDPNLGSSVLVPIPHSNFVERAQYKGETLTFEVPKNHKLFSSSLLIPDNNNARSAPEYVHIRHKISDEGEFINLNEKEDLEHNIQNGGYKAVHYIDYTGDGWIEVTCPELAIEIPSSHAAYSLVTAPDFFPNCDQREVLEWDEQSVPNSIKKYLWETKPYTLSDNRIAANVELKEAGFYQGDNTITAIVSLPYEKPAKITRLSDIPETTRHSYLPDAASGVFAPGWDVSIDRTSDGVEFLAAYGLGSPFPEDTKLCAALSTFWPTVAPDAARTFEPLYPTVSPLTDEEIGREGDLPWDGVPGPLLIRVNGIEVVEYSRMKYIDYVENALHNKFSMTLTAQVDAREYEARVLNMAYVYKALGVDLEGLDESEDDEHERIRRKRNWIVLSFRKVFPSDAELQTAQTQSGVTLLGNVYRFEMYRKGNEIVQNDFRKIQFEIQEKVTLFVNGVYVLFKYKNSNWESRDVKNL